MKISNVLLFLGVMVLVLSCYKPIPRIYNEGTAWKMPRELKVSDFYHDIENIYEYEGRNQEYKIKVKSFFWQDEHNENHTIESAFFIVKRYATGGSFDYAFQYRRYDILTGEVPPEGERYPDRIRELWHENSTRIQRGATLYLTDSNNERFVMGMPHHTGWTCIDGLYEKYDFSMFFEDRYGPILNKLINDATEFRFFLPSDNEQTNGYALEPAEREYVAQYGNFVEMDNNRFSLSKEELEKLRMDLQALMQQKKKDPSEYIEQMKNEILK
jgi:hypothetical protein